MNEAESKQEKQPYQPPHLEEHLEWKGMTAGIVSVPVGPGQD